MKKYWRDAILENIPHGEDHYLNLNREDAITLCEMLLKNGYAVCLTGGDIGDDVRVAWIYAGRTDDLNYPDYDNVAFFSTDYLEEYPEALQDLYEEEYENENQESDDDQIVTLQKENSELKAKIEELSKKD